MLAAACSPDSSGSFFTNSTQPAGGGSAGDPTTAAGGGPTGDPTTTAGGGPAGDPTTTGCAAIARIYKVRERSVGAGGQVVLRLENAAGAPLAAADHAGCLELVHTATGHRLEAATGTSEPDAVRTLLVMAPSAQEPTAYTLSIAQALIEQMGPDEQIGLYTAQTPQVQLSTLRTDATLLKELAERAPSVESVTVNVPLVPSRELREVGRGLHWLRRVILLAPSSSLQLDVAPDFGEVVTEFVVAQNTSTQNDARVHLVNLGASGTGNQSTAITEPEQVVQQLGGRLQAQRTAGFLHLGFCLENQNLGSAGAAAGGLELDLPLALTIGVRDQPLGPKLPVSMLPPPPEEAAIVCDPATVATDWPQVTTRVDFSMTAAQRSIHDEFVDAEDKSDFELSVRPSPETGYTPATAHLRGVSSLMCERKSYTVDLQEPLMRYTLPGLGTDEIQLIAMCMEDEPIHHNSAHALMHQLDLSIIGSQLVELVIDDESRGAYLLLEKHKELFMRSYTRLRSVLRRDMGRDGGDDEAEVKFAAESTPDGEVDYLNFLASLAPLSGPDLETALRHRLHLDQYLRWLALMSLLHSGDYSDELLLIGTETLGSNGQPLSYFHINGWDADDIFQECHLGGQHAVQDEFNLIYCAESELDHKLVSDDHTYGLYVDALSFVISQIPTARFREVVDEASTRLLEVLKIERARLAMVELLDAHPGATDLAVLETALSERANELEALFDARRNEMLTSIEAYRAQQASAP